jgi:ATP-GRASP peptide maturase of grasp-with-spasm system
MTLLLTESKDISSNKVIGWLNSLNEGFHRFNVDTTVREIFINDDSIFINNIDLNKYDIIWDRRGDFSYVLEGLIPQNLVKKLNKEWDIIKEYLFFQFEQKNITSFVHESNHNKLIDLDIALNLGFLIPKSFIVSSKIKLKEIYSQHDLITKPLYNTIKFEFEKYLYFGGGTEVVELSDIEELPDFFFPMLFQEKIEKNFEIRAFYWLGNIYSMAIFSQLDKKTSIDYRNYNKETPNRNIPFSLPKEVEQKIHYFMNKKCMKSGSIDFIYTKERKFIFLEVNPCGQFDWLSINCNYYVEKFIANSLVKYEK